MKVWTNKPIDFEAEAKALGIEVYNYRRDGKGVAFVLRPPGQSENYRSIRYGSGRGWNQRKAWAICWHGHRDFMRAVFEIDPEARIKTWMADYRGQADFEDKFPETGQRNIGSMAFPLYAGQACACGDGGTFLTDAEKVEQVQAS